MIYDQVKSSINRRFSSNARKTRDHEVRSSQVLTISCRKSGIKQGYESVQKVIWDMFMMGLFNQEFSTGKSDLHTGVHASRRSCLERVYESLVPIQVLGEIKMWCGFFIHILSSQKKIKGLVLGV